MRKNFIHFTAAKGCPSRCLPKEVAPVSTVHRCIYRLAGVIDNQSVQASGAGGVRGCDAESRIKVQKCHIDVDSLGLMVGAVVHGADVQDLDGASSSSP